MSGLNPDSMAIVEGVLTRRTPYRELCDHPRGVAVAARAMPYMANRQRSVPRMGALPPRYSFLLNAHRDERFTRCPRCRATTRLRKIPLVIHVDALGLVLLRKTCRLCVSCEMLIAHEFELNAEVRQVVAGSDIDAKYLVLGTLGAGTWRAGMREIVSIEQVKDDMADFAAYMQVEIRPRHWAPTGPA